MHATNDANTHILLHTQAQLDKRLREISIQTRTMSTNRFNIYIMHLNIGLFCGRHYVYVLVYGQEGARGIFGIWRGDAVLVME